MIWSRLRVLFGAVLALVLLLAVPVPAEGAVRTRVSPPVFSPYPPVPGESFVATGRLSSRVVRPVALQRKMGRKWRTVVAGRSTKAGFYSLTSVVPTRRTLQRVVAPAVRRHHRRYAAGRSAARPLVVTAQSSSLAVPGTVTQGTAIVVSARFTPVRPGRPVSLQQLAAEGWRTVAAGAERADGTWSTSLPADTQGTRRLRVIADAWQGAPPAVSAEVVSSVVSDQNISATISSPDPGSTLTGSVNVRVRVDSVPPGDAVRAVRLFTGGAPAGVANRQSDGTWVSTLDTTTLPEGPTELTASVRSWAGRRLTATVPVRVRNPVATSTTSGLPPGFRIETLASGLDVPTSFAVLDEHRTLVTEKSGLVRLVVDGVLRGTPVLDLRDQVADTYDLGMVGIVADPHFADNAHFYLAWVLERDAADEAADPGGEQYSERVARFTLGPDGVAPLSSEHVVLGNVRGPDCWQAVTTPSCMPLAGTSHSVDDLMFRPDGTLLVSVGDGALYRPDRGLSFRAQDLDVLAGKILRVDPATGDGVAGNPYYDPADVGANRGRVWAYGLRNPFRMSLRGDRVYVADVGEDSVEEIDEVVRGGNYGWPCWEGTQTWPGADHDPRCQDLVSGETPRIDPILEYKHSAYGAAVGGVFYDGTSWPGSYRGAYLWGDYAYGAVFASDLDLTTPPDDPGRKAVLADRPAAGAPVKFAIGPDGEVWYLSITTGELRRIVYDEKGTACASGAYTGEYYDNPDLSGDPVLTTCQAELPGPGLQPPPGVAGPDGFSVRFTGRQGLAGGTYAVDQDASGRLAVTVDGATVPAGQTVRLNGNTDGSDVTPKVVVTLKSTSDSDPRFTVRLSPTGVAPTVRLSGIEQGERVPSGSEVHWSVSATDPEDGTIPGSAISTQVTLLHYGSEVPHQHPAANLTGATGGFVVNDDHGPGRIAYRVTAHVTDSSGKVGSSTPVYVCLVGNTVGPCS